MRNGRRSTRSASRSTRDLVAHDVRLTQGGEPTFVSIDDMDGAGVELHRAVAEEARSSASRCSSGSRQRFAPGGFLHYGPGQVVSGRAAAALGARRVSGAPTASRCGSDDTLIADTTKPGSATSTAAQRFGERARERSACRRRCSSPRTRTCRSSWQARPRCRSTSIRCRPT